MHSHDRTLLSRLGFQDPDHKNSKHDLACQYLTEQQQAIRLTQVLLQDKLNRDTPYVRDYNSRMYESDGERYTISGQQSYSVHHVDTAMEVPITKGEGKYLTFIGFMDVCMSPVFLRTIRGTKTTYVWIEHSLRQEMRIKNPHDPVLKTHGTSIVAIDSYIDESTANDIAGYGQCVNIAIEVKATPGPIGDILRQINLYRTYVSADYWVLATTYALSATDRVTAEHERIKCIRLGKDFDSWVASRNSVAAVITEEEI